MNHNAIVASSLARLYGVCNSPRNTPASTVSTVSSETPTQALSRDVRFSIRCKMVSGRADQACGLVARYRNENNFYVTRANALQDNIRLYVARDGQRRQLASWSGRVTPNAWHEYRLAVRGDRLEVFWNGQSIIDHHHATFPEAGRAGVWIKADSVTYFDDLRAEAL